jgi:WD40 repeat protein/serine/threonine protein kinase
MSNELLLDKALVERLPLPLAQIYRRAHNAWDVRLRHDNACYLWEAALKLLGSAAIAAYAEQGGHDPQLEQGLQNLARPALGHWRGFVRELVPALARAGDPGFRAVDEFLGDRPLDNLPRAAALDAELRGILEDKGTPRPTVRPGDLFDRLVTYRNKFVGHGAPAALPSRFYEPVGRALLAGLAEVLGRLDVLAGRRLLYVAEVREVAGVWLIQRYELHGETPQRLPALEVSRAGGTAAGMPSGDRVYLLGPGEQLRPLHPLLLFDAESYEVLFLNARRGKKRLEYLGYTSGRTADPPEPDRVPQELLGRVLGLNVGADQVERWADRSRSEEGDAPARASASPRTLGEFELLSELGRGGMGVVYRAWQPSLGRQVALKKLSHAGDPRAEARFAREIRALGRVEHPNLVKVFTSGSDGEQWFYAMELLEGTTLAAVCERLQAGAAAAALDWPTWQATVSTVCEESRRQEKSFGDAGAGPPPRPVPAARGPAADGGEPAPPRDYLRHMAELVRQVATAAHALHAAGVIHRDVKPGNIMVPADGGEAVLMDLGLARLTDDAQGRLTRTSSFVGTLRYASPEQVLGVGALDGRADVYSLGATLWELLTLRPMFGATDRTPASELMQRVQYEEPEPARRHNPAVPRDLDAVVLKCLEKDPAKRYATAQELADDLRRFLGGEPVRARPVGRAERSWRWCRRHPARVGAAVFGVLAALASAGLLLGSLFAVQQDRAAQALRVEKEKTEVALAEAERQRGLAEAYRARADRLSALLLCHDGAARCEDGDAGRGMLRMAQGLATCPDSAPDLRRAIRTALSSYALRLHTLEAVFPLPTVQILVAFSPDGKTLLFGGDQIARRLDVASGRPLGRDQTHDRPVSGGGFSPDGKLFVTSTMGGTVRVADAATGDDVGAAINVEATVKSVTFSPDGKSLLVAAQFGATTLRCYDLATRRPAGPAFQCKDNVYTAAYSPDGRYVVTAALERNATVWDATTGQRVGEPMPHPAVVFTAGFSPDGKTLVTGCLDGRARLWDVESGKEIPSALRPHRGPVRSAAFSRDGRTVLTGSQDGTVRLSDLETGRPIGQLLAHPSELRHAQFSPDETHIVTAGFEGTARLWRLAREESLARVLPHAGAVAELAVSPDGKRILTGCQDSSDRRGESRLWDLETATLLGPPMGQEGQVMAVAFSPDGELILTGGNDGHARLWRAADRSAVGLPWAYGNVVAAVAFSPDGKLAAIGGRGSEVQLRELPDGKPVSRWQAYEREGVWAWSLAFTPDGRALVSGGGRGGRLWGLPGAGMVGQEMRHETEARQVVLSPDGETVLTCSHDKTARLWSARDGRPLSPPLVHKGEVSAGAFRPDGKVVATASADGTARLWEVPTGRGLVPPMQHDSWVRCVAFRPDGEALATGCDDGTARLWNADDGATLGAVLRHRDRVNQVAFGRDGRTVVTASSDRTARLWTPPPPVEGEPRRVTLWVQVLTGMELDDEGTVRVLPAAEWQERRRQLEGLGGPPTLGR